MYTDEDLIDAESGDWAWEEATADLDLEEVALDAHVWRAKARLREWGYDPADLDLRRIYNQLDERTRLSETAWQHVARRWVEDLDRLTAPEPKQVKS